MTAGRLRVEWQTLAVAFAIYGGYALVTLNHHALPWWCIAFAGGVLLAWHGSLQHEVIHGHPTGSRRFNALLVWPSLWLWLPFERYRDIHLAHHGAASITEPRTDPESYFLTETRWNAASEVERVVHRFNHTLVGRLTIGPVLVTLSAWRDDARAILCGDRRIRRAWLGHLPGAALVLAWAGWVCEIPFGEYALLYVIPSISLTLLRSFAEHRPAADAADRTAVVETGPFFSLLFLNNNLHVSHHREPSLAWYRLPPRWRAERDAALATHGVVRYRGYLEVARRYAFSPAQHPRHRFG